jgi:hypothetical protein
LVGIIGFDQARDSAVLGWRLLGVLCVIRPNLPALREHLEAVSQTSSICSTR